MRFLLDENVDVRIGDHLRQLGRDVTRIASDYRFSLPDHDVLGIALQENRTLITYDRDFGELIFRSRRQHSGVLYFRVGLTGLSTKIGRLDDVLEAYADQLHEFIVVTMKRIRVRSVS